MYQKFEYVTWTLSDYITLFRVADMYLICAEANTRLNRPKGKELLETFKKSRITGFTTYNGWMKSSGNAGRNFAENTICAGWI